MLNDVPAVNMPRFTEFIISVFSTLVVLSAELESNKCMNEHPAPGQPDFILLQKIAKEAGDSEVASKRGRGLKRSNGLRVEGRELRSRNFFQHLPSFWQSAGRTGYDTRKEGRKEGCITAAVPKRN